MKNEEKIVDLLVQMLAESKMTNTKLDKLARAMDTIHHTLDRNAVYEKKIEDIEKRITNLEQKK